MIIYLDESKKLAKWKIVIWWFITSHTIPYINKYINNKKIKYWFKNTTIELKSIRDSWRMFYNKMIKDTNFEIISNNLLWISVEWYYKDDKKKYIKIISMLIWKIYNWVKKYNKDITIIADRLEFWKNNWKVEKELMNVINTKYPLYKWYKFKFVNSKSYVWVQLADLISYQLRLVNINKQKIFDDFFLRNMFNIDLSEITDI